MTNQEGHGKLGKNISRRCQCQKISGVVSSSAFCHIPPIIQFVQKKLYTSDNWETKFWVMVVVSVRFRNRYYAQLTAVQLVCRPEWPVLHSRIATDIQLWKNTAFVLNNFSVKESKLLALCYGKCIQTLAQYKKNSRSPVPLLDRSTCDTMFHQWSVVVVNAKHKVQRSSRRLLQVKRDKFALWTSSRSRQIVKRWSNHRIRRLQWFNSIAIASSFACIAQH